MTCGRCKKSYESSAERCPHCGEVNSGNGSGLFQTSTVLISAGSAELVYRSVDEVPAPLRTKLLKSTNGANSATILIADRRGRREIAKAMRSLPAPMQHKLMQSLLGGESARNALRLTALQQRVALSILGLLVGALVWFVFAHR
jgi:hypothetical protein